MSDLLVPLYKLPDGNSAVDALRERGIVLRRAYPFELSRLRRFIIAHFAESWADEASVGLSRQPVTTFVAIHEKRIIGFAGVECTARGFFGPTGVNPDYRGQGIGTALLLQSLAALRDMGYGYAIIGAAGPVEFYQKTVGAIVIPDSSPGIYRDLIAADGHEAT